MRILETNQEMARTCRECSRPLGLVPTMGALHEGHGMLVRRARAENKTVAVSIFVNPAQFGPQEDLRKYPRDLEGDLRLLRREEADLVFVPTVAEIYPPGFDTWVDTGALADLLEGAIRPGHFRGVATVVTKLLNLTRPDRAYFGQKDGQQVTIVRKLAQDLCLGTDIIVVPTVREPDGLAFSSRNAFLTSAQRKAAPVVYRALCRAQGLWQNGERDAELLRREVRAVLECEPLIDSIDYVSVAADESLEELEKVEGRAMVSVAVRLGATRLIDNVILE
jgi:pantoate--beta-alanine ligase